MRSPVRAAFCLPSPFACASAPLGAWPLLGRLSDDAFGVYVLHYAPVVWLQYELLAFNWPAPLKALVVFFGIRRGVPRVDWPPVVRCSALSQRRARFTELAISPELAESETR